LAIPLTTPSSLSQAAAISYEILSCIRAAWPELLLVSTEARALRDRVATLQWKGINPDVYHSHPIIFNQAFFAKNLFKAALVIEEFSRRKLLEKGPVCDIGAGAGEFALAWRYLMGNSELMLVDASAAQAQIALRVAKILGVEGFHFDVVDVFERPPVCLGSRLYSFWLCEQHHRPRAQVVEYLQNTFERPAVFVDYKEVLDTFDHSWPNECLTRLRLNVEVPELLRTFIEQLEVSIHATIIR